MHSSVSRRAFLRAGFMAAGTAAATLSPLNQKAAAAPRSELATLMDISKCIGCEACVEACRESNSDKFPQPEGDLPRMVPVKRVKIEDWSSEEKQEVSDRLTPYNWLYIQYAEGDHNGEPFELTIPRRCMHCRNAPCVNLCPFGAAHTQTNGIVRIDAETCLGGAKCRKVCPWHIPQRQSGVGIHLDLLPQYAGNGVMYKCDRCYQKVAQGQLPACIEACPEDVQQIGPRAEILAQAKALAAEMDGYIYGAEENGGTNTIYVSPVPFEVLNQAITKGPGAPHLKPVADTMAAPNRLMAALALAPVAGIIGAATRFKRQAEKLTHAETQSPKES